MDHRRLLCVGLLYIFWREGEVMYPIALAAIIASLSAAAGTSDLETILRR